jgi:ADP-heptose:LPS heptosyltransferase
LRALKQCERGLKRLGLAAAHLIAAAPPRRPEEVDLARLERILVVRQDRRLGNLVLLTSLLQGLRQAAPRATITVVAPAAFAPVLAGHPAVDSILALDHRRLLRRPQELAALHNKLRRGRFELAIDASPHHAASFLNGLVTRASGARYRLGYARPEASPFLNLLAPPPAGADERHESALLHDLLRFIAPALGPAPRPRIMPPPGALELAARLLHRLGVPPGCPIAGIHPGGRRQKRWAIERFEAVAAGLAAHGVAVLVFSGPAERALILGLAPPGPRRLYAPPTDSRGLAMLLARLDLFISGDCGPMHLASALGVPCVTVFRIGDSVRYRPLGERDRVLQRTGGEVEPEAVLAAALAILEPEERAGAT